MIPLTRSQYDAMKAVVAWYRSPVARPYFKLFGYAGTGKTSIARVIADELGVRTFYVAPTGKAASVLASKGCDGASTIHRLIYTPKGGGSPTLIRELTEQLRAEADPGRRRRLEREIKSLKGLVFEPNPKSALADFDSHTALVILDESSMVDRKVAKDLLSFGVPVLALGDPAQLPPVGGGKFFDGRADFLLSEIHRTEANSPVARFATQVRNEGVMTGRIGKSGIRRDFVHRLQDRTLVGAQFDQVITYSNALRKIINHRIRDGRGYERHRPHLNDRVMGLRNNYDFGVLNGEQYFVRKVRERAEHWVLTLERPDRPEQFEVPAAKCTFFDEEEIPMGNRHVALTWGYAITGHKAQGSQWPSVLVLAEKLGITNRAWLYTAVTRASDRVVVIAPPTR